MIIFRADVTLVCYSSLLIISHDITSTLLPKFSFIFIFLSIFFFAFRFNRYRVKRLNLKLASSILSEYAYKYKRICANDHTHALTHFEENSTNKTTDCPTKQFSECSTIRCCSVCRCSEKCLMGQKIIIVCSRSAWVCVCVCVWNVCECIRSALLYRMLNVAHSLTHYNTHSVAEFKQNIKFIYFVLINFVSIKSIFSVTAIIKFLFFFQYTITICPSQLRIP